MEANRVPNRDFYLMSDVDLRNELESTKYQIDAEMRLVKGDHRGTWGHDESWRFIEAMQQRRIAIIEELKRRGLSVASNTKGE